MCNSFVIAFARSRDPSGPLSRAFPIFRPPPSPPFAPADTKVSEPAALHVTYRWLHGPSRVICATVRTIVCELQNRACLAELIPRSRISSRAPLSLAVVGQRYPLGETLVRFCRYAMHYQYVNLSVAPFPRYLHIYRWCFSTTQAPFIHSNGSWSKFGKFKHVERLYVGT